MRHSSNWCWVLDAVVSKHMPTVSSTTSHMVSNWNVAFACASPVPDGILTMPSFFLQVETSHTDSNSINVGGTSDLPSSCCLASFYRPSGQPEVVSRWTKTPVECGCQLKNGVQYVCDGLMILTVMHFAGTVHWQLIAYCIIF